MKVLQCHNYYQQPGGEDRVLAEEAALLRSRGHTVEQFLLHNDDVNKFTALTLAAKTIWSRDAHRELRRRVEAFAPDVVHVHNTLPLMSPSVYSAARAGGAAVVQTLHNYRMVCPGAYCQRDGEPCEKCVTKRVKWPALQHACYRESRAATAPIVAMLAIHDLAGTFRKHVDRYIVCSDFARHKMIEAGFMTDRLITKPNFRTEDLGQGPGGGGYALYIGRLSPEKGVATLMDAWDRDGMDVPLHVVGGGPMEDRVREVAARRPAVNALGHVSFEVLQEQLRHASLLVFPSVTYEGHPMTLLEAMQAATPIVGSRLGAIPELILEGKTGRTVLANDPVALGDGVAEMMADPQRLHSMRGDVRRFYESRFGLDTSYERLIAVYEEAIRHRHGKSVEPTSDHANTEANGASKTSPASTTYTRFTTCPPTPALVGGEKAR
ncbi:MAG: glycosyltransferase family 4 protein [Planctomycetota bacterium]